MSKYLWLLDIPQLRTLITPNALTTVEVDNKTFDLTELTELQPYNFDYTTYTFPHVSIEQQNLRYIPNTSFLLNIYDTLKKKVQTLPGGIFLTITLDPQSLAEVQKDTLKLYYFDELAKLWMPFLSYFNSENTLLTAQITHLSRFAVFADALDATPPETVITVTGELLNGWFSQAPVVALAAQQPDIDKIFYSLDTGTTWEEYVQPFTISSEGVVTLMYTSSDISGNYETPKAYLLKINKKGKLTSKVRILETEFQVLQSE